MDEMKQTEQNEYPFIRETIVNKRRRKLKRVVLLGTGVVAMAMIFGLVARICFVKSESFVNQLLGVSSTPTPTPPIRQQVVLPSRQEEPTAGVQDIVSPTPTAEPSHIDIAQGSESATENLPETDVPDASLPENELPGTNLPEDPTGDSAENHVAGIADFVAIYQEIRRVATNAASAMATITVTTERTDWFEQVYEESTTLSGIIVGDNSVELLILTEASPLLNADKLKVTVGGYTTSETVLFAADEDYNLAVIGIDYASIPAQNLELINYALFGESHTLFVGTPVIAIGNPNGYTGSFELGTVTARNSYAYVTDNRLDLFNTSIPDYENGTGVIINTAGEVIGLITHSFKEGMNQNLNTVIGISKMKPIIEKLVNGQKINLFGIVAKEMPETLLAEIGNKTGILVAEVEPGSPAEAAGIRKDDILLTVNEETMSSVLSLRALLDACEEGNKCTVSLLRKGQRVYAETEVIVEIQQKQ